LSDHFRRVTIIERDPVSDQPESRKGQPQTRHLHGILEPARRFAIKYFPGVQEALLDGGAVSGDFGEVVRWHHFGGYKVNAAMDLSMIACSRPFFEWLVRRSLATIPNVTLCAETAVQSLIVNDDKTRVTGLRLTQRGSPGSVPDELEADLIVDASGRGSAAPKWLDQLGYPAPTDEEVKIGFGYTTRIYRRDPAQPARIYMIAPTPPDGKQGAYMFPIEGDRWIVTGGGFSGAHPPSDEAEFMKFLQNLPASDIYDVLKQAQPLSDIITYNFPASRRRHYERIARFPDGFLVLGDAVASFNPIYGQGMSSASMQAEILNDLLAGADPQSNLHDIWRPFFTRVARVVDLPWQLAVGEDFRYPETEGHRPPGTNLINRYVALVHRATQRDPVIYRQFLKVMHLIAQPTSLMQPHIMLRVLRANFLS
jgi:2-polyprenyl-6-methoxyphenol hydroxylase-like FAD-dependent oxidoreductase